jgi:hypothetical protein
MSKRNMNHWIISTCWACFVLLSVPSAPVSAADIISDPVAIAGTSLDENGIPQLNGTLSEGWQGDYLAYVWQIEGEALPRLGPIVAIDDLAKGTYLVTLTVSNAIKSDTDTMLLAVSGKGEICPMPRNELQQQVFELQSLIAGYSEASFPAPSTEAAHLRQQTLVSVLGHVCAHMGVEDYQAAIDLLLDILEKSDAESPPADWIVDDPTTVYANEQQDVAELVLALIAELEHLLDTEPVWTIMEVYEAGNAQYLFLLSESDGFIEIHVMNNDGTIGEIIQTQDWSSGWTLAEFFAIGDQTYLFLLKESDGTANIRRVYSSGTLSDVVERYNWSPGWTSAQFYSVLDSPYQFLIKESDGVEVIYRVNPDGSIGTLIQGGRWSPGWTQAEYYTFDEEVFASFLKESDGTINVKEVASDGTFGDLIQELQWSEGYTILEYYVVNDAMYAFFLKTSDGTLNIRRMNANGTIGAQVQGGQLSAGWTHAQFYQIDGVTYLLLLDGSDGSTRIFIMEPDGSLGPVVN